jgi:hypothetical protein
LTDRDPPQPHAPTTAEVFASLEKISRHLAAGSGISRHFAVFEAGTSRNKAAFQVFRGPEFRVHLTFG